MTETSHRRARTDAGAIEHRADPQPGGRVPAPGALQLVQAFVNTFWDLDDCGREQLDSPSRLAEWLVDRDLLEPGSRLDDSDLRRALDVREGLRSLLLANNGAPPDPAAVDRLNRALDDGRLSVHLAPTAPPSFTAERGDLTAALAVIGAIVAVAQLEGTWSRFKACRGAHCGWAFYDHSRNQLSKWCAMSVCGSRAKARTYRVRRRRSTT